MGPSRERALLIEARACRPTVASWIIHLQAVCCIRVQYAVEPCAYSRFAVHRRCDRTKERIATAKYPQLASDYCRPWHVNATGHTGPSGPRVRHYVVVIQRVEIGVSKVAPTGYVDVSVDNTKAR